MSKNYLITGYHGEPHITPENDRSIHAGICGDGKFVLPVGERLRAEYVGNNTIRLYDGVLMDNGAAAGIPSGEYVDLLIANTGQGMRRNDLIVFQYEKDLSTMIETGSFVVIQGEATNGSASDPELTRGNLLSGVETVDQFPLWRVAVSGGTISAPVQMFDIAQSLDGVVKYQPFEEGEYGEVELKDKALAISKRGSFSSGFIHAGFNEEDEAYLSLSSPNSSGSLEIAITETGYVTIYQYGHSTIYFHGNSDDFNINVGGKIHANNHKDGVVESGAKNGWSYRKWDSGIAECWGRFSHTAATADFVSFMKDYPFAFSEAPCVTVSGGANGGWTKAIAPYNNTFSTDSCAITYKNSTADTVESDLNIHAFGRWK